LFQFVFSQTIYRYVIHLGRRPSKTITIKTFRKTLFHTKRENSNGYSHEISENSIKKLEITNGLGRTLLDCVFHEILQNSHMELKYDFKGGEWKRNQICNL
ncbi:hypothetical protein T10_5463, partial [Trichinella papuae]